MRIIGAIHDDLMKITVLEMNLRVSLKFEFDFMEQTFKLNEEFDGNPVKILEDRLTPEVRVKVLETFKQMKETRTDFGSTADALDQFPELF